MTDFEQMLENSYRDFLHKGDICVDVGAHAGRHSFPMAECVGKDGRVYAFEPIPAMARFLGEMLRNHSLEYTVKLYEYALGDVADGSPAKEFLVVNEAPEYSGFKERVYDQQITTTRINVQVQELDSFMPQWGKVSFIKVDCEGAELQILRGGKRLIQRDQPIISFECGDNSLISYKYTAGDIFDFFSDLGYVIKSIYGDVHDRELFVKACAIQDYWDYIAFPRKPSLAS